MYFLSKLYHPLGRGWVFYFYETHRSYHDPNNKIGRTLEKPNEPALNFVFLYLNQDALNSKHITQSRFAKILNTGPKKTV